MLSALSIYAQDMEWVKGIGGFGWDQGSGISVDGFGNVYVIGNFSGSVDFDPGAGIALLNSVVGSDDVFVAKYDVNGNYLWAIGIGSNGYDEGGGITVDDIGNVYVTGSFSGTADFNPGNDIDTLTRVGGSDVFLAKYDSNGNYLWAKGMGGGLVDAGADVALDGNGNVYLVGYFNSITADFNPDGNNGTLTRIGGYDAFLAKYDANGNYLWAKNVGGSGNDYSYGVDVDGMGNVYMAGFFRNTADFNAGNNIDTLTSVGSSDVFLAKYDSIGNYLWARNMGGSGLDYGYDVVVDATGNVYVTGYFNTGSSGANFNMEGTGGVLISAGRTDVFVAKYDANGKYLWANSIGGNDSDEGWGIALDAVGNVYVTGPFLGSGDFDPGTDTAMLTAIGFTDVFVAKYDSNGSYLWAKSMGGHSYDHGTGIAVDGAGKVYLTGYFSLFADFNPGGNGGELTGVLEGDVFVLKLSCRDTSFSQYLVDSAECGYSYTLNGEVYTTSGTYTQRFPNTRGCDSTIVLDLTFYPITPAITIDRSVLGVVGTYVTYQWIKDGADIPGANSPTYVVTENGDYSVRVTAENGCEGTSAVYIVDNVSIGDRSDIRQHISVYPNPTNDMVYIQSPIKVNVTLTDIEGRIIKEIKDTRNISLKEMAAGMYLMRITDQEGVLLHTTKVVKQ